MVSENFRPGVMEKLGLGYEALKARRPQLIYASASGYGPDGPYVEKPGQDLLAQALFGMMAITGQAATGPRPAGASVIDHHGAALFAMGILAAIVRRQRTGQGCRVDASLMQAALDLQAESLVAWANAPVKPAVTQAFRHVAGWYYAAPYGVYATKDGHHRLVACRRWQTLAEAIGEPRLAAFTEKDTWSRQDEITELIAQRLKTADDSRVGGPHGAAEDLACAGAGLCADRRRPAGQAHEVARDGSGRRRHGRAADVGQPSRSLRRASRRGAPATAAAGRADGGSTGGDRARGCRDRGAGRGQGHQAAQPEARPVHAAATSPHASHRRASSAASGSKLP